MAKDEITDRQGVSILPQSGWFIGDDIHMAMYLVPLFQERCYRIADKLGSRPWAIYSLDDVTFFLLPRNEENIEETKEDRKSVYIKTDFYDTLISLDGLGITATLYACKILAGLEDYSMAEMFTSLYSSLREYAESREDAFQILAAAI